MNVALYPRVSTEDQALNGHSIDEQIDRMKKYCDAMGWTVYNIYTDAGFSGANTDRPGLQRMIKDCKAGRLDKVLVYKLDRLSRSQLDTLYLIERVFLANNTDFVSMSENFDTSTPFGKAMIGIIAVFAQLERENIKERMMMGKLARAKQGKFGGSNNVPIGYDYVGGDLIVNEFEAMQIRKIFSDYAAGRSPYQIADDLNAAGYHHKFGTWNNTTIREILSKKTYLGYTAFKGNWYQGNHEPLIDAALFDKVQLIREQRTVDHERYHRRTGLANSYLGGYLICAQCGAKYSRLTQLGNKQGQRVKYFYYACNSRTKKRKEMVKGICHNKNWREDELNDIVFSEIRKLSMTITDQPTKAEDNSAAVCEGIKKTDEQITRLLDLYSIGQIPKDILQDKINVLTEQKRKLETELNTIESTGKIDRTEAAKLVNSFGDIIDRGDLCEIRTVIGDLIEFIELDDDAVKIHWNFV